MEKVIKDLLTNEILEKVAKSFGIKPTDLSFIGGFQNFVYEYEREGKPYILRITHSSHRTENQILGELDFILYLVHHGVAASKPIPSIQGDMVIKIEAKDSQFFVTSFEKAIGEKIGYPACLGNKELFKQYGELTGKIHALSKEYHPSIEEIKRHQWWDNYYLQNIGKYIPQDQPLIHRASKEVIEKIKKLQQDKNSFGLIHGDINVGNVLVGKDGMKIYDFDEAQYSWFVEDIAIQLFYICYIYGEDSIEDRREQAKIFMKSFMEGYKQENTLEDYWLRQIPLFLQLREIIVYVGIYRSWDFSNLNEWQQDYLRDSRARIEAGIPLLSETDYNM